MSKLPSALMLSVSPSLKGFNQSLMRHLSWQVTIAQWEYCQSQDEPSSLEVALVLLHDYLKTSDHPVHLIGHGISGLVGLLYARRHPERVKSLILLSVGMHPAVDWQAHYHVHLKLLPCSREIILMQMVYNLFGYQSRPIAQDLVRILEQDLCNSLSPHTVFQSTSISPDTAPVPTLVCGSKDDIIITPHELQGWRDWLGAGDRIWKCPQGRHFFHYFHPQMVTRQILNFWASLPPENYGCKKIRSNDALTILSDY
jgi:pimeloyl-ACP methyl ester carboxylesterase